MGTNDVPTLRDLLGDLGVLARVWFSLTESFLLYNIFRVGTNDVPTLRDLLGDLGVLARVCFRVGLKNPATRSQIKPCRQASAGLTRMPSLLM